MGRVHGNITHGFSDTKIGRAWYAMMDRCYNTKNSNWHNYGGRGIRVCKRWRRIQNFVHDMGRPTAKSSLDRLNNNGNYTVKNCVWSSRKTQARNRRTNRVVIYKKRAMTVWELSQIVGIERKTICYRLDKGDSVEQAVRPTLARKISFNGKKYNRKELAIAFNISPGTFRKRLRNGYSIKKALSDRNLQNKTRILKGEDNVRSKQSYFSGQAR